MTEEDYDALMKEQNYACAICRTPFTNKIGENSSRKGKACIDHDHQTKKTRGLLCHGCNLVVGFSQENEVILQDTITYLGRNAALKPRIGWSGTVTGKVWGETVTLMITPFIEIHRIKILPNAMCSLHEHKYKNNTFICLSGKLMIDVHKNNYDLVDTTTLYKDNVFTAPPGEFHKFRTGSEGAEALEIYHLDALNKDDINRKDVGSIASPIKE